MTDCVIDGNICDGVSIGNTPGPYTRPRQPDQRQRPRTGTTGTIWATAIRAATVDVVIDSNDFWGNGLDGVRIDRPMVDAVLLNNRIRNNGRQCARRVTGGSGESVRYTRRSLRRPGGGLAARRAPGQGAAGGQEALPWSREHRQRAQSSPRSGPDAVHRVERRTPRRPGAAYELPAAPECRAGITIDAPFDSRHRPRQPDLGQPRQPTQTHGLWITERGSCVACRVEDNDLAGNAVAPTRLDTPRRSAAGGTVTTVTRTGAADRR